MKLYIRQKVFSWRDKFAVKDEQQNDRWFAQGEIFTLGRKLHVYDTGGTEVAYIRQKLLSFLPRYYIEIGDKEYEFVRELKLFRPKYTIRNLDWVVDGNFFEHEYSVMGYVRSRRLAFAAAELSGGRKILDIALDYGFETHSGFSKAFKRHFGCTPETFRVHTQYSVPIRVSLAQMKDYYIGGIVMDPIFKTLPTLRIAGHAVRTRTVGGENIKAITDFWSE